MIKKIRSEIIQFLKKSNFKHLAIHNHVVHNSSVPGGQINGGRINWGELIRVNKLESINRGQLIGVNFAS